MFLTLRQRSAWAATPLDPSGATPSRSATSYPTLSPLPGPGRSSAQLLDIVPGRTAKVLRHWINDRDEAWRRDVQVASLDPYRGYATALSASLPRAVRVLDAFHIVRLGLAAVDDARRRISRTPWAGAGTARTRRIGPGGCCAARSRP